MNCPECRIKDVDFLGQVVSASSNIAAPEVFEDERGLTHLHDPTILVVVYRCAIDHEWSHTQFRTCWCGWKAL